MNLNLMTSKNYPNQDICKQCKHYKEKDSKHYGKQQIIDSFCSDCYSDRVYIITRFEKRIGELNE